MGAETVGNDLPETTEKQKSPQLRPYWFKPGQTGNPKGRPPKGRSLAERTRKKWNPSRAVRFYLGVVEDETNDIRVRMDAANWLSDRAYGKPVSTLELGENAGGLAGLVIQLVSFSQLAVPQSSEQPAIEVESYAETPSGGTPVGIESESEAEITAPVEEDDLFCG